MKASLVSKCGKVQEMLPYLMVQPCLKNRMEYKVLVQSKRARYVTDSLHTTAGSKTASFCSLRNPDCLLQFAESAVLTLEQNCPEADLDGTVRVDIMQRSNGLTVVNEFESLEACIFSKNPARLAAAKSEQKNYWLKVLGRWLF